MDYKVKPVLILDEDDDDDSVLLANPFSHKKNRSNSKHPFSVPEPKEGSSRSRGNNNFIDLTQDFDDDDDVQIIPSIKGFKRKLFKGESSISQSKRNRTDDVASDHDTFMCDICVEEKSKALLFCIKGCVHSYCYECMTKYVAAKLQDNITVINCPVSGCNGRLEPENCKSILPPQVFDRWCDALCEALLSASEKFYCPYKDCSVLLIDDRGGKYDDAIVESECPECRRLFCAKCRVPWHSGVSCDKFQKLNKDERGREDILLMKLAKKKKVEKMS